jgi:hypothetical protein
MTDGRLKRAPDPGRESRESQDRVATENRQITDDERLDMYRQSFSQEALPDLPKIPGYHVCWCTTTNPRDSIHRRLRLGYEPIKPDDIPGWENVSLKTGEYAGCIGVNEMIAMKLPLPLYERYMLESHHNLPRQEEERLADAAQLMQQEGYKQSGGKSTAVMIEEGLAELRNAPPRPRFSD